MLSAGAIPLFWNVNEAAEPQVDVTNFGFRPRNATQVGNSCAMDPPPHSNAGCQHWTQGLFPTIGDDGTRVNGGVPQAASLTAHLAEIERTLPLWLPDPDFDGNAVLDFEAWTTVWELNADTGNWHGVRYQDESKRLVRVAHPEYNESAVEAAAKAAFEAAATTWFVKTLEACRQLRPSARWGFYGLPIGGADGCVGSGADQRCGYEGSHGAVMRRQAEVTQRPIWEASTALFPSIYLHVVMQGHPDYTAAYIGNTVRESVKCAGLAGRDGPLPVYPYGWDHYHSGATVLDEADLMATLEHSAENGAAGVVMWGGSAQAANASYWKWFEGVEGPRVEAWCATRAGGC